MAWSRRNSLALSDAESIDPIELDDPSAQGIDHAMAKFGEDFIAWAGAMPAKLVPPVLDILRHTHAALDGPEDAAMQRPWVPNSL